LSERSADRARIALITGGGSGIGLATARRLLASGWKVAIADRDERALTDARTALGHADRVATQPLDVTDEAAATAVVGETIRAFGGLDGVVNCAGVAADIPALDTPIELFRKILDINVVGTFIVARVAARAMKDAGGGAIVNLSSVSGLRGSKGRSAYGASKGAVVTLTQVLTNDLARYGIRVNAVAPGPVDTPMVKALHSAEDRAAWKKYLPMRRYGDPDEIATAIEFLLDGSKSGYITGEILAVDGGFRGAGVIAED
jgi:NAD(P)-dependent dehydrogenase (short-subunit alcohol dehydrogenase family)